MRAGKMVLLPKLQKHIARGNMDILALIKRQMSDFLGGEPVGWHWCAPEGEEESWPFYRGAINLYAYR